MHIHTNYNESNSHGCFLCLTNHFQKKNNKKLIVTRVKSVGTLKLTFNIVTKNMESFGYSTKDQTIVKEIPQREQ